MRVPACQVKLAEGSVESDAGIILFMNTLLPACPHCGSTERQTKHGHTPAGSQRYHCFGCQRLYTPVPQEQGYAPEIRQMAVRLYLEGNGLRRIGRLLGCHPQSVANWVDAYQARLQEQSPKLPVPDTVETVELDELYTFVEHKKTKYISSLR